MSPHELFDCVVKEYELLVVWNEEIGKFLEKDVAYEASNVTY